MKYRVKLINCYEHIKSNQYKLMSVYSGFATRKDEANYNTLLTKLIKTLISHVLELVTPLNISNTKAITYSKIITKIQQYDEHKYLEPKFGEILKPLAELVGMPSKVEENLERTHSRWDTPHYEEKAKTPSSSSQHRFRSRKVSQGGAFQTPKNEEMAKGQKQRSLQSHEFPSGRQTGNDGKITPSRKDNRYMSFYSSELYQHDKISRNYNKKLQQLQVMKESGMKFGPKFNRFRANTQPQHQDEELEVSEIVNNCVNLKTVKQAQSYLQECQKKDKLYRKSQNITFSEI